jgi:TolB-like protein
MFKSVLKSSILASSLLLIAGCTQHNSNDVLSQEYNKVQTTKQHLEVAADMQKYVTTQSTLEATIASLAAQMMQNKKMDTNKPVLITSFVRLDEFKKTTEFGRVVSESLINELSNRGFNIIEYRGQMAVSINDEGEYFISRKPHELKGSIPNTYIVVGTYSRQAGRIMLNARVIDNITGKIITSARSTYAHGVANDCILFRDCAPARTINIVKER